MSFILADHPIPPRAHYGDFPLVENGVGMIRNFLDEFRQAIRKRWTRRTIDIRGTVVTGRIFYPALLSSVQEMNTKFSIDLKCLAVDNLYFGRGITVAGLLTGSDILEAERPSSRRLSDRPLESMTGVQGLFLDDWTRGQLEEQLELPVFGSGYHLDEFQADFRPSGLSKGSPCLRLICEEKGWHSWEGQLSRHLR
jgi:NifB/MoaA-like Fe-S oxidoreductase